MVNPLRAIRLLPSREAMWITGGFYALCITLFLMPFPRTLALWTLGVFLFFGLMCWITDFPRIVKAFNHNKWVILPPAVYFILSPDIFYIWRSPVGLRLIELMFLLVPLAWFASNYFRLSEEEPSHTSSLISFRASCYLVISICQGCL